MAKPSLRDRRRTEAREAYYRALDRRNTLCDALARNSAHIKKLRAQLARLDKPLLHTGPASVAEGKLLEPYELKHSDEMSDDIPELTGWREP